MTFICCSFFFPSKKGGRVIKGNIPYYIAKCNNHQIFTLEVLIINRQHQTQLANLSQTEENVRIVILHDRYF